MGNCFKEDCTGYTEHQRYMADPGFVDTLVVFDKWLCLTSDTLHVQIPHGPPPVEHQRRVSASSKSMFHNLASGDYIASLFLMGKRTIKASGTLGEVLQAQPGVHKGYRHQACTMTPRMLM